ncbi:putative acetyltransferase [Bacillus sp. TS-2]|nr:putative acetyltransferase [Bacillus sp. TS-2]
MIEQGKSHVRLMTITDLEEVMKVEKNAFANPWKPELFEQELKVNRFAHYLVYELEQVIIGYCGLWVIADEAQITNIAVHANYRGQNRGEELLTYALHFAKLMGAKKISLEVRQSNTVAQNLYRKLGFQDGGIRKNYYTDNLEDALVMWVNL